MRSERRSVHQGSLGTLGGALVVVGFIRGRLVHPGSYILGVVGFIWGRWVHSGSHCGSLGSSGVVGFIQGCPGGRYVHLG